MADHHGGGYDTQPATEPDIHIDRLYADMNRAYLYGLAHENLLRPWYHVLNCVNHFGMETHLHDRAGYRYGLLSALALAGELTFNDAPDNVPEAEFQFTQHWEQWARANKDYLKQNDKLFERSVHFEDILQGDADSLAGYSHIRGNRGVVFLINPGPVEQIAELTLALDAPPSTHLVVEEVYPGGMALRGPSDGTYLQGGGYASLCLANKCASYGSLRLRAAKIVFSRRMRMRQRRAATWAAGISSVPLGILRRLRRASKFHKPLMNTWPNSTSESAWSIDPWAYDKAYLVVLLKDENVEQNNQWVSDHLLAASGKGASGRTSSGATASTNGNH